MFRLTFSNFIIIVLFVSYFNAAQLIDSNLELNEKSQGRLIRQVQTAKCEIPNIPNGHVNIIRQINSPNSPAANYLFINVTCKPNFKLFPPSNNLLLCVAGFWEKEIPTCIQCGQRLEKIFRPLVVNGAMAKFGDFPWHVAIYYKETKKPAAPEYLCGGSIINDKFVLTVAHCFANDYGEQEVEYEYYVGAGKYYSNYFSKEDEYAQIRKVIKVENHPRYRGILANYAWDIALVVVNEPFEISNIVQPICIDWTSDFESEQLREHSYGHIAGWGLTEDQTQKASKDLRVLVVPYIGHNECLNVVPSAFIRYVTQDKFCAGFLNGSSVCSGDSGGGLVFERFEDRDRRFYIRGLVSVGVQNEGNCDSSKYSTYTKVSDYLPFIQEITNKKYEEEYFPITTTIRTTTTSKQNVPEMISGKPCKTPNGEDAQCISIYNCKIFINIISNKQASSGSSEFLRASRCGDYHSNEIFVCCGSVANFQIKSIFMTHQNFELLPPKGTCGVQSRHRQRRVIGGSLTKVDDYPWMALLFYEKNGETLGNKCQGALITQRYVLTAAHCLYEKHIEQLGNIIRVRLGEYNLYTSNDCDSNQNCNEPHIDIEIEQTIIHPLYKERAQKNQLYDIAIIRLARDVIYTNHITPICLPLHGETTPAGQFLDIVGWGVTETGVSSQIKLKAAIPAIDFQECTKLFKENYQIELNESQMCAGGLENSDFCTGDSGGPLVNTFPGTETYYMEGIASFGGRTCGSKIPGVYTRVYKYINWILDNMKP